MSAEDVEWYRQKSDLITKEKGKKVYSLAFQHIIVPEVYDVLKKVNSHKLYSFRHMYNKNEYYMFDPNQVNFGTLNETPCCGFPNYGQFEAMVEKGDVLGVFSGHDHTNAFAVKYKGIDIGNSLSTRFNGDRFSTMYGYRILEVNENNTALYTTRIGRWYNMYSRNDIKNLKATSDDFTVKVAKMVTRKGYVQRFMTKVGRTFTAIVTRRQVTYTD